MAMSVLQHLQTCMQQRVQPHLPQSKQPDVLRLVRLVLQLAPACTISDVTDVHAGLVRLLSTRADLSQP